MEGEEIRVSFFVGRFVEGIFVLFFFCKGMRSMDVFLCVYVVGV